MRIIPGSQKKDMFVAFVDFSSPDSVTHVKIFSFFFNFPYLIPKKAITLSGLSFMNKRLEIKVAGLLNQIFLVTKKRRSFR